jgi:cytochrome c-type biogenesis protein CcmH/NrfG
MNRRIIYAIGIAALVAIVAFLWACGKPRPVASPLRADNRLDHYDRLHREAERLGTDGLRAKLEATLARRIRVDEASERQRNLDGMRRQRIYFVAVLALATLATATRLYVVWAARRRISPNDASPRD